MGEGGGGKSWVGLGLGGGLTSMATHGGDCSIFLLCVVPCADKYIVRVIEISTLIPDHTSRQSPLESLTSPHVTSARLGDAAMIFIPCGNKQPPPLGLPATYSCSEAAFLD